MIWLFCAGRGQKTMKDACLKPMEKKSVKI